MEWRQKSGRFLTPQAFLFRESWAEFRRDKADKVSESWTRYAGTIEQSWLGFMRGVLSETGWLALRLLLERQMARKQSWLKPGGYFFTRAGNRRKWLKEKLRPKLTVTDDDRMEQAAKLFEDTLVNEGLERELKMALLALSGAIEGRPSSIRASKREERAPGFRKVTFLKSRPRLWPWTREVGVRLRALEGAGLLSRPDRKSGGRRGWMR